MRDELNEKTTCLLTLHEEGLQEIKSERKCVPAVCFHRLFNSEKLWGQSWPAVKLCTK